MNAIKFTKICDHRDRTLLDAKFRPGRQHDQTGANRRLDDLLEQPPSRVSPGRPRPTAAAG